FPLHGHWSRSIDYVRGTAFGKSTSKRAYSRSGENGRSEGRVQFNGDAADAALLRSLPDDADDGSRRFDGHGTAWACRRYSEDRRDNSDPCPVDEPDRQWSRAHFLGLGLGPRRPRADHGPRVLLAVALSRECPDVGATLRYLVHRVPGACVFHLGRGLRS